MAAPLACLRDNMEAACQRGRHTVAIHVAATFNVRTPVRSATGALMDMLCTELLVLARLGNEN